MTELETYISKSESAISKLFFAINSYSEELKNAEVPVFISEGEAPNFPNEAFERWAEENDERIQKRLTAEKEYCAESFALANLCGAVLQSAAVTIRKFSMKRRVPEEFCKVMDVKSPLTSYCIGRKIRNVHLGMIIYAGRNQYNHFEDGRLKNQSLTVFDLLRTKRLHISDEGGDFYREYTDPAFDLDNAHLECYAHNILALMEWRSYGDYKADLIDMLSTAGGVDV